MDSIQTIIHKLSWPFLLSAKNLEPLDTDHWLSNAKNICVLRLDSPVRADPSPGVPPAPATVTLGDPRTWGAPRLAAWLRDRGVLGPAGTFCQNGVSGADFADMTLADLIDGLRVLSWTAKKLLRLREDLTSDS